MSGSLRVKHFFNTQFKEMLSKSAGKKKWVRELSMQHYNQSHSGFDCNVRSDVMFVLYKASDTVFCFLFISIVFEQKEKNYWDPLVCSVHASEHACSAFMACKHSTMQYKKVV